MCSVVYKDTTQGLRQTLEHGPYHLIPRSLTIRPLRLVATRIANWILCDGVCIPESYTVHTRRETWSFRREVITPTSTFSCLPPTQNQAQCHLILFLCRVLQPSFSLDFDSSHLVSLQPWLVPSRYLFGWENVDHLAKKDWSEAARRELWAGSRPRTPLAPRNMILLLTLSVRSSTRLLAPRYESGCSPVLLKGMVSLFNLGVGFEIKIKFIN